MKRLAAVCAVLGALLTGALFFASAASAHATLTGSTPGDGERLASAPAVVTLDFDEAVSLGPLTYLNVTNEQGTRVDSGSPTHPNGDATKVSNTLKAGLGDGTYTVSYRIISADSHPVAGVVRFVVGNGALVTTPTPGAGGGGTVHSTSGLFSAARWLSYAGLAGLGGLWLLLTVWPAGRAVPRAVRLVRAGWWLAVAGAVCELLLQGPYVAGRGPGQMFSWALLDDTLHTSYGRWHLIRLALLGALAIAGRWLPAGTAAGPEPEAERPVAERFAAWSTWPLLAATALTFGMLGHARTTNPVWLSVLLDCLHLLAMSAWLGGLGMLLASGWLRRHPRGSDADETTATAAAARALPVFSLVAMAAVATLVVTGVYSAWRGVGSPRAIFTTSYGWLVIAKVAGLLVLMGLGNMSRLAIARRSVAAEADASGVVLLGHAPALPSSSALLAPASEATDPGPDKPGAAGVVRERMRRGVWVEVVVAMLVLVAAAVLVNQPRGREALAADDRKPVTATAPLQAGRVVQVTIDPGVHGTVSITVELSAGTAPQSVTATATQPDKQIGPLPIDLKAQAPNRYAASGLNLPVAGTWRIDLVITSSAADAITTAATLRLH